MSIPLEAKYSRLDSQVDENAAARKVLIDKLDKVLAEYEPSMDTSPKLLEAQMRVIDTVENLRKAIINDNVHAIRLELANKDLKNNTDFKETITQLLKTVTGLQPIERMGGMSSQEVDEADDFINKAQFKDDISEEEISINQKG